MMTCWPCEVPAKFLRSVMPSGVARKFLIAVCPSGVAMKPAAEAPIPPRFPKSIVFHSLYCFLYMWTIFVLISVGRGTDNGGGTAGKCSFARMMEGTSPSKNRRWGVGPPLCPQGPGGYPLPFVRSATPSTLRVRKGYPPLPTAAPREAYVPVLEQRGVVPPLTE
jgi:hypothetical protein